MKLSGKSMVHSGKIVLGVWVIIFFTAGMAAGELIFKETFEDDSHSWVFENNGSGTEWAIDTDKNHTAAGDKSANCADDHGYAHNSEASIKINIDLTEHVNTRLSFWCFYDGELSFDYGQVKINGVQVAPPEGVSGYACRDDCPPDWEEHEVNISAYDKQEITLEFYFKSDELENGDDEGPWDGFYIDDIEITGDYTLTAPDAPVIDTGTDPNDGPQDGASGVSIDTGLNWTNPGDGENTDDVKVLLDVNPEGGTPTTVVRDFSGSLIDSLDSTAIGGPLSGSSTYYWTVITKNTASGETASSTWSFKTECAVVNVFPWTEDFEGDPDNDNKWEGTPPQPTHPRCWTQIPDPYADTPPTNYWEQTSIFFKGDDVEGVSGHSARGPWASEGGVQWLLTPELDMSAGECNLKFSIKGSNVSGTNVLVYIGKTNNAADLPQTGNNDNFALLKGFYSGLNMPTAWEDKIIDLAAYSGINPLNPGYKYIAFKLVDDNGWSAYIDDVIVYEFNDRTSTVTDDASVTPASSIESTVDTQGEAAYVFDVSFNDGALGAQDGYPTIINQIKFTQHTNTNEVSDWTNAIAGALLFGPDLGEETGSALTGDVFADHIIFQGEKIISVDHDTSETYKLMIWLKTDLSAVQDGDQLGFELKHADIVTHTNQSSIFIIPDPENPVVSTTGVEIQVTATQLKFTTQPHDRAVVNRVLPITPVVAAQDVNGNIDVDYFGTVTLTNDQNDNPADDPDIAMVENSEEADQGVIMFNAVKFTQIGGYTKLKTINGDGLVNDTATLAIMITDPPILIWKDNFEEGAARWNAPVSPNESLETGEFQIGAPEGKGGSSGNPDPVKAYDGSNVMGTDLSGLGDHKGDCEPDLTDDPFTHYTATSETIDCEDCIGIEGKRVTLNFYRWLNTQNTDYAYIEVFDGSSWNNVWTTTDTDIITENDWSFHEIDISAYANNNANLKIRFGYGPTDSNFYYSGWNIDNVEIVQHPVDTSMHYSSSEVIQEKTNYVVQGATDQEIIGIKVVTNMEGEPILDVTGFEFDTQGTTQDSDISRARVYYTADSPVFATTNQFGNDITSISGTFSTSTANQPLLSGVNYFWLVYDIASDALVDHYVDARCTQITIGGATNYTPSVMEPFGNRKIISPPELKDVIYILQVLTGYDVSHPFLMTLDYNANGVIDMGDALFALEYIAQLRDF